MGRVASILRLLAAFSVALAADFSLFSAAGCAEPRSVAEHVLRLWFTSVARCLTLWILLRFCPGNYRAVLNRLVLTHSVLPALFETGTIALWDTASRCASWADAQCWLLNTGASLAATFFWEATLLDANGGDGGGKEGKQRRRVVLLRVLRLIRPDALLLLGGLVFLSLAELCEMFIPFYTGKVIDTLRDEEQQRDFFTALTFMGLYSVGSSASAGCRRGIMRAANVSFTCRIKVKLFQALTRQEVGFFETTKTGEITSRLAQDAAMLGKTVGLNVNLLLRTFIKTMLMIFLMMQLSWKLTLLVLLETPLTSLIQSLHDTHYQRLNLKLQDSMAVTNEAVNEVISGVGMVRSFNAHRHEHQRYKQHLKRKQTLKTHRDTVTALYKLVRRLTGFSMQVLMLYCGRSFIQGQQMTTGSLVSFILYQSQLGESIRRLTMAYGDTLNSVAAARKVFELLDREPQISMEGTLAPEQLTGHVSFRNLNFSYPACPDKRVLHNFSLELKPGEITALVGLSGHGKSTCGRLMERLYEPQEGEILLDNIPLRSYEHNFLHKKISVVSQQPVLFSGSIRDNIAYGLPDCSFQEIERAASEAAAHDFISRLEKGYDTEVGEGGGRLSQSERQLIAIARALVRQPKVLVLDEITSALDAEGENKIQQALWSWSDQTLLVVAHRLKTIEKAHQILLIHEGRVQERGTHQELMDLKGNYFRLREKPFAHKGDGSSPICEGPSSICDGSSSTCDAPSSTCDGSSSTCDAPSSTCDGGDTLKHISSVAPAQ
ncbi:antigen peptide transporter 2-like isoform X1 [Synchiropus splendidus]|uniref:antigen peptide transporter 2-like isoform X1 n=1 Tax=Synchiropus splendidus TaxID=270530 RepID=UPI00237E5CE0|nr:antigen peptide transporter 2-like isoform X1 [Synchiropus splendidus]